MGNNVTLKITTRMVEKFRLYRGLQSRVARHLGVSRSTVSRVMQGKKTSRRVTSALRRELERVERKCA